MTVYQQEKEYTFPIPSAIEDNKFYYAALPHKVNTFIDKALMDKINSGLKKIQASGEYDKISDKYFAK